MTTYRTAKTVEYIRPGQSFDDDAQDAGAIIPYSDQVQQGLVRSSAPAFVAPDPRPITPARITVMPPAEMPATGQPLSRSQSVVTGDYVSRAKGFALVTNGLGLTLGSLGVIVAVAGWGVPLLSVAALAWFASLFTAVWLFAYVAHLLISAEGASWIHVRRGWRWLDAEQAHRHYIERRTAFPDDYRGKR